jgi:hypothetical protein
LECGDKVAALASEAETKAERDAQLQGKAATLSPHSTMAKHISRIAPAIAAMSLLSVPLGCVALAPDTTPPAAAAQMTPGVFAAHVDYLAAPAMGGRVAGTAGNRASADYVAEQFRKTGLSPAGDEGTYFQSFPYDRLHVPAAGCGLAFEPAPQAKLGTDPTFRGEKWGLSLVSPIVGVPGKDFAPSAAGKLGAFSAPLVFAGYGLHNHVRGYDDYAHLSARGAVVMILAGEPHNQWGQSKWALQGDETHLAELPYKLRLARQQGAVAALVVTPPLLAPQDDIDDVLGDCTGALPAVRISRAFANRLLAARGEGVSPLRPEGILPSIASSYSSPAGALGRGSEETEEARGQDARETRGQDALATGDALATLVDRIHQTGQPQSFAVGGSLTGKVAMEEARCRNIIGILPPDQGDGGRVVFVGAHYDHIPATGQLARDVGPGVRSGAEDNASGVSAMLLLARALAATTGRRTTYVFAAFDAEEVGFGGSRYQVQHPAVPLERVELMVNIDQVGYVEQAGLMLLGTTLEPPIAKALARARSQSPLRVEALPVTSSSHWSDQAAFVRAGVPTLFVYDGRLKSPYHSRLDTAEKVNVAGGAATAKLVYGILRAMDESGAK